MQPLRSLDSALRTAEPPPRAEEGTRASASGFAELVTGLVSEVNRDQIAAEESARDLAAGRADIVDAMLALNRADLSLRFMVTLRNRALEAYQEIMRTQV